MNCVIIDTTIPRTNIIYFYLFNGYLGLRKLTADSA